MVHSNFHKGEDYRSDNVNYKNRLALAIKCEGFFYFLQLIDICQLIVELNCIILGNNSKTNLIVQPTKPYQSRQA